MEIEARKLGMSLMFTAEQKKIFCELYREAYTSPKGYASVNDLYKAYDEIYGIPRELLIEAAIEDHRNNRAEYEALMAADATTVRRRKSAAMRKRNKANEEARTAAADTVKRSSAAAKRAAEQEEFEQRAAKDPEYYTRSTLCPSCHRDFDRDFMPPHEDRLNHKCLGSGRFGVTKATVRLRLEQNRRGVGAKRGNRRGSSIRTVGGGLPGTGKRYR